MAGRHYCIHILISRCKNDTPVWGRFLTLQKLDNSLISIAEIDIKVKPPIKASLRSIPVLNPGYGTKVEYTCSSPVEELYDDVQGNFIWSTPESECRWNGNWYECSFFSQKWLSQKNSMHANTWLTIRSGKMSCWLRFVLLQQLVGCYCSYPVLRQDAGILNRTLLGVSPDLMVNSVSPLGHKWIHSRYPGLGTKKCKQAYCDQAPIPPANHRLMLRTNNPVRLGHKWKYSCEPGALPVNQGRYVSPPTKTKKKYLANFAIFTFVAFPWLSFEICTRGYKFRMISMLGASLRFSVGPTTPTIQLILQVGPPAR